MSARNPPRDGRRGTCRRQRPEPSDRTSDAAGPRAGSARESPRPKEARRCPRCPRSTDRPPNPADPASAAPTTRLPIAGYSRRPLDRRTSWEQDAWPSGAVRSAWSWDEEPLPPPASESSLPRRPVPRASSQALPIPAAPGAGTGPQWRRAHRRPASSPPGSNRRPLRPGPAGPSHRVSNGWSVPRTAARLRSPDRRMPDHRPDIAKAALGRAPLPAASRAG